MRKKAQKRDLRSAFEHWRQTAEEARRQREAEERRQHAEVSRRKAFYESLPKALPLFRSLDDRLKVIPSWLLVYVIESIDA